MRHASRPPRSQAVQASAPARVDLASILSVSAAAGAVVAFGLPGVSFLLAVAALLFAVVSRRRLRGDPHLRGSRLALAGFLIGAGIALIEVIPVLIGFALVLVGGAPSGR